MERVKMKLIYPKWKKLPGQTTFNLPPHGPVAFKVLKAGSLSLSYELSVKVCVACYEGNVHE